ncbi:T9SS type A sorting domain-containing protein [Natronoflexus pectinivorans]|uniref:Putative secreted protein (Por secretion system target) n=1 Tax=Natronoflexus pectinivorans TaxID=682526 RepID=A0A4R2GG12_9BACT|nr:T9SS type A sorting domain-containing protein [Natronoflexus pectinivorans]TCO07196.1 putative secreted protein (Por secretion system target) [Natronoflexus pectinivorans]
MKNFYSTFSWKSVFTTLCVAFLSLSVSATTTVTLRVDMTGQGVSEAFVSGTFTDNGGWSILPMTREGETDVYFIELELTPGVLETYYFLSANDWNTRESVPEACWTGEWDNHRGFTVPDEPVTYGYMFGGCDPVGSEAPDPVVKFDITFRVDMTGQDISNGVFVTGNFTAIGGGDWNFVELHREGETDVFSSTVSIPEGNYTYAFWRHNNWEEEYRETVPEECALSGTVFGWDTDRLLVVADSDKTVEVLFGSCDPIGTPVSIKNHEVLNVELYPVPASEFLNVAWPGAYGSAIITIYNVNGGKVVSQINSFSGDGILLNVSALPAGVYLVEIELDDQRVVKRITIK